MVWTIPPMPMVPYQVTRWRLWFIASVPTRIALLYPEPLERLCEAPGVPGNAGPVGAGLVSGRPSGRRFRAIHAPVPHDQGSA
jgi:hypothetical protein